MMSSSFKYFNLYSRAINNYKLTIILFTNPFLYIIYTNTDSSYIKFVRHNLFFIVIMFLSVEI